MGVRVAGGFNPVKRKNRAGHFDEVIAALHLADDDRNRNRPVVAPDDVVANHISAVRVTPGSRARYDGVSVDVRHPDAQAAARRNVGAWQPFEAERFFKETKRVDAPLPAVGFRIFV